MAKKRSIGGIEIAVRLEALNKQEEIKCEYGCGR